MRKTIPSKIVREIIADILIERSNAIDDACDELIRKDLEQNGVTSEYTGEVGWTACGTRVLADDIREGIMSIEEAIECLTAEERKNAKNKCQNWLSEREDSIER